MGCFASSRKTVILDSSMLPKPNPNPLYKKNSTSVKKINEEKEENLSVKEFNHLASSKIYSENIKIKNLITKNESKVEDNYRFLNKLGKGSFGSVFKVLHIATGIIRAMKVIKKNSLTYQDDDQKFLKEIEILIETEHPNIIRIYEYYFDNVNFYLITEFVSGGELYETITSWKTFDEEKACYIITQILSAVNYLHKKNIVHRDIKPENMLVENKVKLGKDKKELINIKLIDFGTCNYITEKNLTLKVGSPYYIAPEVLKRNYNEKCDIWSCGVIFYILLVGYPPFSGANTNDLLSNVEKGHYSFNGKEWSKVSSEAKDLVAKMLEFNPSKRISADKALDHVFINNFDHKNYNIVDQGYFESVLKNIYELNAREKLQQATIAYIVHFLTNSQETEDLKKVFKRLDKDGDGRLTYIELKTSLEKHFGKYKSEADLDKIVMECDGDNDGWISYEEFLRVSINQEKLLDEKNLFLAFEKFDLDRDGKLSKEEIKKVLGTTENEYVNDIINYIDDNHDGFINFEEFKNLMNGVVAKKFNKKESRKKVSGSTKKSDDVKKEMTTEYYSNYNSNNNKDLPTDIINHSDNMLSAGNLKKPSGHKVDSTGFTPDLERARSKKLSSTSENSKNLKLAKNSSKNNKSQQLEDINHHQEVFDEHVSSGDSSEEKEINV